MMSMTDRGMLSTLLVLCEENHQSPVDSPHKGQQLDFFMMSTWISFWTNGPIASDWDGMIQCYYDELLGVDIPNQWTLFNTLGWEQTADFFQTTNQMNENYCICIEISLKSVPRSLVDNNNACLTQPQWDKTLQTLNSNQVPTSVIYVIVFVCYWYHIDGLVQDCSNSIANALELLQSCTKPSILFSS